ncbi:MAG: ABC transporter ATP-binding protein [Gemmataceae bacterium]
MDPVIEIHGVSRRFGDKVALDDVSLVVPRGGVFGLVGPNGSGKTTLIKHSLGLFAPQTGTVRVFGLDPVRDPAGVLGRIGCLTEDNDLPGWMRVDEFLRYTRAFYPAWDDGYAGELVQSFALDPVARLKNLSRGQRARVGLVAALAHKPDLLVLDEPSSGLDALVRRDILGAVVRTVADEGRTVLFSSHLLDEVERVADRVAMIVRGRIAFAGPLEEVRASHRRLTLRFPEPRPAPPALAEALAWEGAGREWTAVCSGVSAAWCEGSELAGGRVVEDHAVRLDEIFVARAGKE